MSYHIGLQVLRAKVRGFQAAGISIHSLIRKAKGLKRNELWVKKRCLGSYSREHLIAYGLLRGVSYERIEKCAKENKPSAVKVFELMKAHGDWDVQRHLTLEHVKELLQVTSQEEKVQARTLLQMVEQAQGEVLQKMREARRPLEKACTP